MRVVKPVLAGFTVFYVSLYSITILLSILSNDSLSVGFILATLFMVSPFSWPLELALIGLSVLLYKKGVHVAFQAGLGFVGAALVVTWNLALLRHSCVIC